MSASQPFDYIIVGGGTAGLALAGRLTEDPAVRVCVVEAGEDVSSLPDIMVPGMGFRNVGNPKFDWAFSSSPQKAAKDRELTLPRGKGLGGSSILNLMEVGRGHSAEYDAFETLGATGWNWENLLKYFKKSETFTVLERDKETFGAAVDTSSDGTAGPIQRTLSKWISNTHFPFQKAAESLGVPFNPNSCSGNNVGVWNAHHTIDPVHATRSSSASGYYEPAKSRPNWHVITGAVVTRVLLEGEGPVTARGVEYVKDGVKGEALARKEVILAAGSFQTPQLLELSGIGNKSILSSHGIHTHVDLPGVGENYQDHFWLPYTTEIDDSCDTFEVLHDPARAAKEFELYQTEKGGMLSTSASTTFAFLPTTVVSEDQTSLRSALKTVENIGISEEALDIQKKWAFDSSIPHLEFSPFPGFMPAPGKSPEAGKKYFSFFIAMLHPFARGTVHIHSADPLTPPVMDPQVINNDFDLELFVEAIKFARRLAVSGPFALLTGDEVIPGPEATSDADIREYVRKTVQTTFHPIGTASMLPREKMGVVDATLKVYGTTNLRVVDASIMPIHISAHTQATVYAIAEKAADIIKAC